MPGRSPGGAREAFLDPLRKSLSCVTRAQLFHTGGKQPGEVESLALSEDPLHLHARQPLDDVQLLLAHQFKVIKTGTAAFRVTTTAYRYHLLTGDYGENELIAWHWHPKTSPYPHVHVSGGLLGKSAHVPTGRVSIESVMRFLIDDLGVPKRRDDYQTVLEESEGPFVKHRGWHSSPRRSRSG